MGVRGQIQAELDRVERENGICIVYACLWIERGYGVVPIEFHKLVERVIDDAAVRTAVEDLVRRKKSGEELDRGPHIPEISGFLQ